MSIGIVRALAILASQGPTLPPPSVAKRTRVHRHRYRHVPVTWIDAELAPTATIVHLHGGSYVSGEQPTHWEWLEEVSRRSGAAGAMIHYRMPPKYPFPAAFEETLSALDMMGAESLLRPGRWVLSGDGAGGGLALAVAQALMRSDAVSPAALLLTSPWVDLTDGRHGDEVLQQTARMYARGVPAEDSRVSPLLGELAGLPPMHLVTGSDDVIVADSRRLHDGVTAAGGEVEYLEAPGQGHGHPFTGSGPAAQEARRAQIATVRSAAGLDSRAAPVA